MIGHLNIGDYHYDLPEERIAFFPVDERDHSKLLIYNGKQSILQDRFTHIIRYLPANAMLVFNNTRVIHARFVFSHAKSSSIEVFCLRPLDPAAYETSLKATGECTWECMIGNLKKWKEGSLQLSLKNGTGELQLSATRLARTDDGFRVRFSWDDKTVTFGEILNKAGLVPLPPYIKRQPVTDDDERYQTVYALHEGSVAAPTAGLHFTDALLQQLKARSFRQLNVTLHVGAGTFVPVKSERIRDHIMHAEQFSVSRQALEALMTHDGPVIAVGTTALRTLESLYWMGSKTQQASSPNPFVDQWEPYECNTSIETKEALKSLVKHMIHHGLNELTATTQIMIVPGYRFRLVDQLITNFHLPRSTLLLLVAAFIGDDWKKVYRYALENDFRFLSYGDSSLLIPGPEE